MQGSLIKLHHVITNNLPLVFLLHIEPLFSRLNRSFVYVLHTSQAMQFFLHIPMPMLCTLSNFFIIHILLLILGGIFFNLRMVSLSFVPLRPNSQ